MRISVSGSSIAVQELKTLLRSGSYAISDSNGTYTFDLNTIHNQVCNYCRHESGPVDYIIIDSIDSELERLAIGYMEELGVPKFMIHRANGNRSERRLEIQLPERFSSEVALGIYRAVDKMLNKSPIPTPDPIKKKRFFGLVSASFLLALIPSIAIAQNQNSIIRFWNPTLDQIVAAGDAATNSLRVNVVAGGAGGGISQLQVRDGSNAWTDVGFFGGNLNVPVNCMVGCSGSSFLDKATFTYGTTPIGLTGYVVNETVIDTVAEGKAGLARMNVKRIPLSVLMSDSGDRIYTPQINGSYYLGVYASSTFLEDTPSANNDAGSHILAVRQDTPINSTSNDLDYSDLKTDNVGRLWVNNSGVTQPVSGTFWQTTQPVSWSGQTVTATQNTGSNLHTVIDSGSTVVTQNTGSNLHVAVDSAPTTAVTGTFWQTTQPVSGTFWQTTQPVSWSGQTVTATQGTGSNLHAVIDTGSTTAVTQGTGSNLHTVLDSGTLTSITNSVTVGQGTGTNLHTVVDSGSITATQGTGTNLHTVVDSGSITVAQSTGTNLHAVIDTGSTTAATQATASNLNVRTDTSAATGGGPTARADYVGGLGSGATGGFVIGIPVCDTFANVNVSTATTTLIVTGVSGRQVRICAISLVTAAANNVALISGTGATCGTGTTAMNGSTTAASGYNFAANGGIAYGSGLGTINQTNAAGDSVCIVTSAATQLSGRLSYTIY